MNKNRNLTMLLVIISLFAAGFSGYHIYKRINLHLYGDSLEVNPEPVDLDEKDEAPQAGQKNKIEVPEPTASTEETEPDGEGAQTQANADENKKTKAVRTTFEYKDKKAKKVLLSGSFQKWKDTRMKGKNGTWALDVYILPGNYFYHFVVDGKKVLDSKNPKTPMGESLIMVK